MVRKGMEVMMQRLCCDLPFSYTRPCPVVEASILEKALLGAVAGGTVTMRAI